MKPKNTTNRVTVTLSPCAMSVLFCLTQESGRSKDKEAGRILNPSLESLSHTVKIPRKKIKSS